MGIYLAMAFISVVIKVVCVDKLPISWLPEDDTQGTIKEKISRSMASTIKHIPHLDMLLLLPITMFSAIQNSFFTADFNKVC